MFKVVKRYICTDKGSPYESYGEPTMREVDDGQYVLYSDYEKLQKQLGKAEDALKFYANKTEWKRDWDAARAGIEEWQYSVMTHDLEEQNEHTAYAGRRARQYFKEKEESK